MSFFYFKLIKHYIISHHTWYWRFFGLPYSDRVRTSVNVLGDGFGACIVDHLSRAELEEQDRLHEAEEAAEKNQEMQNMEEGTVAEHHDNKKASGELYPQMPSDAAV